MHEITDNANNKRRSILKMMAGAPLLPMTTAMGAGGLLAACGGSDSSAAVVSTAVSTGVTFNNMLPPSLVADRAATFTNASISVAYSDGIAKTQNLKYVEIYKTGDALTRPDGGAVVAGGFYKPDGVTPINDHSGSTTEQFYSDCPDGTSLIKLNNPDVPGISGNPLFLVTQFEYKNANNAGVSMYGRLPSPIGIATLNQDKATGALSVKSYYNVPTSGVHGLWITCAASLSPWNTHLSSEEYEPDAWTIASNDQFKQFSLNTFGSETAANPYHYGHVPEVTVQADGTGIIKKHYCMGRISRELVQVMPDKRTVLMGDDATSGGMFMFVADNAGKLSSGTLYAAKFTQKSAANGGSFDVAEWIKLGHANSADVELMTAYKAADIFDMKDFTAPNITEFTAAGYTLINHGNGQQWVKIISGMEQAAAFLETRRYAAIMGATMEFTKFEGVTVNAKDKKAYIAISAIKDTMTANGFVADAIQTDKVSAGAVYEVVLGTDATIGSDWVPQSMSVPAALLGADMSKDADGNSAVVDKIANPDNVKYSEAMRTLFIGEDSGMHLNNFVWAYNIDSKKLSRILSVPAGAESTGLHPVDNLNGFAYVMSNFQHPGDWSFTAAQANLDAAIKTNWGDKKKAAVGYISGIPILG